ncbi:MAG: RNA polymerase sigma factor [Adhaeribacter sp.]
MPEYDPQNELIDYGEGEAALWRDFKEGSETAYALIYRKYAYLLYSYGSKICPDQALVEDGIQDLFIKLWVNKSNLGQAPSIKNYLLKSFRRLLKDAMQKHLATQDAIGKDLDFKLSLSFEGEESQQQLQLEKEKKLQEAMEKLSARQKEVIYLRFYKKLPNEEIAEVMAISVPAVYNLVSKALAVLETHIHQLILLLITCRLVAW